MHGVRLRGVKGDACKYHELVGMSNSTTTAMALAAVTAIVFIDRPSDRESMSRIAGTRNQIFKPGFKRLRNTLGTHRNRFWEPLDPVGTDLGRKNIIIVINIIIIHQKNQR